MSNLSSLLGGITQGIQDFGKSAIDMFGTGGAAIGDLIQSGGRSTKNQDDFRKWLYGTNSVKDASSKGLGTALNGASTVAEFIPVTAAVTKTPLGNSLQGAIGGVSDELKFNGENADLGRAGQRAALGATTGLVGGSVGNAVGKRFQPGLASDVARGAFAGGASGALASGGNTAIEGGNVADILGATVRGAGGGALLGGGGAAFRGFVKPQTYQNARSVDDIQADIDALRPVSRFSTNPDDVAVKQRKLELLAELSAAQKGFDTVEELKADNARRRTNREVVNTRPELSDNNFMDYDFSDPVVQRKMAQSAMVQQFNPKDYSKNATATWIENPSDIKTYREAVMGDNGGEVIGIAPDFTDADMQRALSDGYATVYSTYPIEPGTFVTPSKMISESYGVHRPEGVYSKRIPLKDVAWLDGEQGQYTPLTDEEIQQYINGLGGF